MAVTASDDADVRQRARPDRAGYCPRASRPKYRRRGQLAETSEEPRGGPRLLQHLPAGVRRCRAARRHLPHLQHVLDPRRAADSGNGPVPSFGRDQAPGHSVGAVRSAAVGIVGSTLGLLLGLGVAQLLKLAFGLFGLDLGGAGLVLLPRTVLIAYAVGVIVTVIAAYVPARRAAKIAPVAAMRDDVALPQSSRKRHAGLGGLLTALGAAAIGGRAVLRRSARPVGSSAPGSSRCSSVSRSSAPVIGPPIVRVIAAGSRAFFGTVGRLARENAQRNPRRTAATASALMIGLALVATMSVLGQSANKSIDKALDDGLNAQFVVSNAIGQPFSPAIADEIAELDGVAEVARVRYNGAQ